ncbi:MAG: phenylalanine--tRNA ligase subunit beta, partial [Lachnospiraceae bacterium]|nr:phenylalanine--tRNA ligase subunit beta [Lachnospiraceae bacterium]
MFISMNWISDFVDLSGVNIKELINRFTLSTAEVEDVYEYGKDTKDVVVARIVSLENHPNSKKLHLLKVDTGSEVVDVVCGAPNAAAGQLVALCKAGGSVKGTPITAASVGGFMSYGMCCSEKELGISEDHSGIMVFDESYADKLGTDIKTFIPLEDTIFEVDNKSLTNRPDLWGHYGIAREIAALLERPLKPLEVKDTAEYANLPAIDMAIETDLCFRYSCIGVSNVTKNVSPLAMKVRLTYCGQRPINLLADLTNYLMLELGQPMHAFDKDTVSNIRVKQFDTVKEFVTLDGNTRAVDPGTMMICDGDTPVAVAGIMGGLQTEITEKTTNLLLESANFEAATVRRSAAKLGMRTEASARYEKTLDPEITVPAIERFLKLLVDIDPGAKVITSLTDSYKKHYETIKIDFDKAYVDKYTGIDISADRIEKTLKLLAFDVTRNGDAFSVVVPSFRATKDVTIKADIIEEITRIYGYDNFDIRSTKSLLAPVRPDKAREDEYSIKQLLSSRFGMSEVHSYIWYDNKWNKQLGLDLDSDIRIVNSEFSDNVEIRRTDIPTLLSFVEKNVEGTADVRIFEICRVARGLKEDGLANERKVLSFVLASRAKTENALLGEAKEIVDVIAGRLKHTSLGYAAVGSEAWNDAEKALIVEPKLAHRKNSAVITADGKALGVIAVLDPRIAGKIDKKLSAAYVEIDYELFAGVAEKDVEITEISKF